MSKFSVMIQWVSILILLTVVFVSALAVVVTRYHSRVLFIELQRLQQQRDKLNESWGQLQLELSTLAQPQRIETAAREKLLLRAPNREEIVILRGELSEP
jgi:cell division protein FtsL